MAILPNETPLQAVTRQAWNLKLLTKTQRARKDVVMVAVKNDGRVLEFASEELRADREVAFAAITQTGQALYHVDPELKTDRVLVLLAIENFGGALAAADISLKNDKQVVTVALQKNPRALQYASMRLQSDPELAWFAVTKDGRALEYVSPTLKDDRDLVLAALNAPISRGMVAGYISERLQKDREIALLSVGIDGRSLWVFASNFAKDFGVVHKAISNAGIAYTYADISLRADPQLLKLALDNQGKNEFKLIVKAIAPPLVKKLKKVLSWGERVNKLPPSMLYQAIDGIVAGDIHAQLKSQSAGVPSVDTKTKDKPVAKRARI